MKKLLFLLSIVLATTAFAQETEEFKPHGKIEGLIFGDYYYKVSGEANPTFDSDNDPTTDNDVEIKSNSTYSKKDKDKNAFSLRRIYFGYKYYFTPKLSARIMLEGNDGYDIGGKRGIGIKYAYGQWNDIIPNADLYFGAISTITWSIIAEKTWGYRSIEKTIMDMRKDYASSDLGIALKGSFDTDGIFGYNLMVANGKGQKPEDDKYKKFAGSLNVKLLDKKLIIGIYADHEAGDNETNAIITRGEIAYKGDIFTAGAEGFQKTVKEKDEDDIATQGFSIYARASLAKEKLGIFARYDFYNYDANDAKNENVNQYNNYVENLIILGLDYTPAKNFHIMPNVWINSYNTKTTGLSDRDADIVPRLTFYYKFK